MIVVKYPDFNKERSKAVLFDGKRLYVVNVEIGDYEYSHVDYENGVICLRRDSPDIVLEFLHEIHHLYEPLLEPIWTPTLPTLKDECIVAKVYADENAREEIIKTIEASLKPKNDPMSILTVEILRTFTKPIISLGRFDNIIEDIIKIHDHLIEQHKIPVERLNSIEKHEIFVYDAVILSIQVLYRDNFKLLKEYSALLNSFVKRYKTCYGLILYSILDFLVCMHSDLSIERYYNECVRSLRNAIKHYNSKLRGIFKRAIKHRIELELFRVKTMRNVSKIPCVINYTSNVLRSSNIPTEDMCRLLNFLRNINSQEFF